MMDITFVSKTYFSGNLLKSDFLERATTKKKEKKKKERRKTKMNRVYRYILFVWFCFIQLSGNVPETVPKCTCDNTEPCFLKRSEHNTGTRTTSVVSNENGY